LLKYIKYLKNEIEKYGILKENKILELEGSIFEDYESTGISVNVVDVKILSPTSPSKVIALGYNYKDLVGERIRYDEPVIFIKPGSSVIGPNDDICIPENKKIWTEVELGIVIGKKCKNVEINDAKQYIFGFTIGNDVTMENILNRDHHLARSKACDTFCPLGPHIETELNTDNLNLINKINGTIYQNSNTNKRILSDCEIIGFISKLITLYPGDVILTGTPANAEKSLIYHGDIVSMEIQGLGKLSNKIKLSI